MIRASFWLFMARVSDHFFLKFLVLVVQNTGVFEQIGDFEGLGRPHARNCKCTIVEEALAVQNLVSDPSGNLVPEALESWEDGQNGTKIENFAWNQGFIHFYTVKWSINVEKSKKITQGHLGVTWGHARWNFQKLNFQQRNFWIFHLEWPWVTFLDFLTFMDHFTA